MRVAFPQKVVPRVLSDNFTTRFYTSVGNRCFADDNEIFFNSFLTKAEQNSLKIPCMNSTHCVQIRALNGVLAESTFTLDAKL